MSSAIDKIKYLSWDADSVKNLIKYKLSENGKFTDQLFEDSNLSILIDVFAHTFECMTYMANIGASEAIFNDAVLYENINRISKIFGYNPKGVVPATISGNLYVRQTSSNTATDSEYIDVTIPKFTRIGTGKTTYSFTENYTLNLTKAKDSTEYVLDDIMQYPILSNGIFKLYPTVFSAQGVPFETFVLDALPSLRDQRNAYISHTGICVYVKSPGASSTVTWSEWSAVQSMLMGGEFNDEIFEVRLNENYVYELKFGDNVTGKKLEPGSLVYIVYLESYGIEGIINQLLFPALVSSANIVATAATNEIDYPKIKIDNCSDVLTMQFVSSSIDPNQVVSEANIKHKMGIYNSAGSALNCTIGIYNNQPSTNPQMAELTSDIKNAAPSWFRTGNRLVTKNDFTNFIKYTFTDVIDVLTMNNFEYMASFQSWLKKYDKLTIDVRRYDYPFSDACDFNNVYIWFKSNFEFNNNTMLDEAAYYILKNRDKYLKYKIIKNTKKNKVLTSEVIPIDAVMTCFTPCLKNPFLLSEFSSANKKDLTLAWNDTTGFGNRCKIYIYKNRNAIVSIDAIKTQFINTMKEFFNPNNLKLGMSLDLNTLANNLLALDGINSIKTAYINGSIEEIYDGLSFAKWTLPLIDSTDFDIVVGNTKLEDFQFPFLLNKNRLADMITVKSDNYMISEVTY